MNKKEININPVFLYQDFDTPYLIKSFIPYLISILEIGFIIIVLYYFFYDEIIFIYTKHFKKLKLEENQEEILKEIKNKIFNLYNSTLYCDNNILKIKTSNNEILDALNFSNEVIKFKNNSECEFYIKR